MPDINIIQLKVRRYARRQNLVDLISVLVFTCALIVIVFAVALLLMRSPWYALLGIMPLFFIRPRRLMTRARELEKRAGLKGEIVSSLQLGRIPRDNKERYSQKLIDGYITTAAQRVRDLDVRNYISYDLLKRSVGFLLIALALGLVHPAFFPGRFWYALNHRIEYTVSPGNREFPKDAEAVITLYLSGVYVPKNIDLKLSAAEKTSHQRLKVENGNATTRLIISDPLVYSFEFLEHKTTPYELYPIEPLTIENLSCHLEYPAYTNLGGETRTGRQLIVPYGTVVNMTGKASQKLREASFEFSDTVFFECENRNFSGRFVVRESGTAILNLTARSQLREPVRIYAIPDLAPLVDIFYPGFDVDLPYDLKLDIGVRCSDDYGLAAGTFCYSFRDQYLRPLPLKPGAFDDTTVFTWDLSELGLLPGDEVSYYVLARDNSGQVTRSNSYIVHFPTMEQMYEEVNEKETLLQIDLREHASALAVQVLRCLGLIAAGGHDDGTA